MGAETGEDRTASTESTLFVSVKNFGLVRVNFPQTFSAFDQMNKNRRDL